MKKIEEVVSNFVVSRSDSFVVDYTNDDDKQEAKRGVEIVSKNPNYPKGSFMLLNSNRIEYYSVNFERNRGMFKTGSVFLRNCECMFASTRAKKKKWALLVELKYGKESNIGQNAPDALDELEKTLDRLIEIQIINFDEYRVYFNISFPEYSNREPFDAFVMSPADLLAYREKTKVTLWGYNCIKVMNEAYLRPESTSCD